MKKTFLILFLFFVPLLRKGIGDELNAQNQQLIDSLQLELKKHDATKLEYGKNIPPFYDTIKVNLLFGLAKCYKDNNPSKSIDLAHQSLLLAQQNNFKKGVGNAFNLLGLITNNKGDLSGALDYFYKSLKIREEINDKSGLAFCYNNIGSVYLSMGNLPSALQNQITALKIREEINDKTAIAASYNNIGSIFMTQQNYSDALAYFYKALNINRETGNTTWEAINLQNIGSLYSRQNKYSEALKQFGLALKLLENTEDWYNLSGCYLNTGDAYFGLMNYTKALENYKASSILTNKMGDNEGLSISKMSIGKVLAKQKEFKLAVELLNQALILAKEVGSLEVEKDCYKVLTEIDSANGNYGKALNHYKLYIAIRDSMYNAENNQKIAALQIQFNSEKKEQQIVLLNKDTEIRQKEISKKKTERNGFIGGFVLVMMIGIVSYNRYRVSQRANNKLLLTLAQLKQAQQQLIEQEKLASVGQLTAGIAHEIQNPLNFVINFSQISSELFVDINKTATVDERNEILTDLEDNITKIERHGLRAEGIIKNMLLHDSNAGSEKQLTNINELCNEAIHYSMQAMLIKYANFTCRQQLNYDENLPLIKVIRPDMLRVLVNLLNNALYTVNEKQLSNATLIFMPEVIIKTYMKNDNVYVEVTDNGNGIPDKIKNQIFQPFFTTKPTNHGTGLGLSISYDIVKSHNGTLSLGSSNANGTTFVLSLPTIQNL